jgi:hypothetical protein
MINDYECPKCHNIFPSQNRIMHDLRCTEDKPMPLDSSRKIKLSEINNNLNVNNKGNDKINVKKGPKKKNSLFEQEPQHLFKNYFEKENDPDPDIFVCNICGEVFQISEKADHLYCHNLESEEKKIINNNISNNNFFQLNAKLIENQKNIEKQIQDKIQKNKQKKRLEEKKKEKEKKIVEEQKRIEKIIKSINKRIIAPQIRNISNMRRHKLSNQNQRRINSNFNQEMNHNISLPELYNLSESFLEPVIPNHDNPTDKNILSELPETFIEDASKLDNDKKSCSICFEDFKNGDKSTILPCLHFFHTNCIGIWLKTQNFCPICKFKLVRDNIHN